MSPARRRVLRLALGLVMFGACTSGAQAAPVVTVYGSAGSFGTLGGMSVTSTGQSVATQAVPGWGFLPGDAAYFTTVAPDGTVFIANEPQTDNQLQPTATGMTVTSFSPSADAFRNISIPTTTGVQNVTGPWPSATLRVGGADISDVAPVTVDGQSRIAFLSANPYDGWSLAQDGVFPTLGYLTDGGGGWNQDTADDVSALSISRSATAQTGDTCLTETGADSQPFADCRLPAQLAALPDGNLVVTQYGSNETGGTSGGLMVLSPSGQLQASYAYPTITLPDGQVVDVHPREVDADPVSPDGDEHFVVVFDSETGGQSGPFAMQEFAYVTAEHAIVPLSAPVLSGSTAPDGTPLGFETAAYDGAGDLWAAQSENGTVNGGPIAVYLRQPDGSTLARPGCTVPAGWSGADWGTTCAPDEQIDASSDLGIVRSLNLDPWTGAMLASTMSGDLLAVLTGQDDDAITPLAPIDLGLNNLADRSDTLLDFRLGSVSPTTHTLFLPAQQLQSPSQCATYPCPPTALDQWLVGVDLDSIVGDGTAPSSSASAGGGAATGSGASTAATGTATTGAGAPAGSTGATRTTATTGSTPPAGGSGTTHRGATTTTTRTTRHQAEATIVAARVDARRATVALSVRCANRSCRVVGTATAAAGASSSRRRIGAGRTRRLVLHLGPGVRRALGRHRRTRLRVTIFLRTPQGRRQVGTVIRYSR